VVHVEPARADELPAGLPAVARPEAVRDAAGKFVPGAGTSELARKGAKAAHESRQLAALLGLWDVPDDHPYAPYARLGREWRDAHIERLSATIGGGEVGPGPASIVSSAALQLAASRWLSDKGAREGDAKLLLDASRLANDSRQALLAAHELCAREAEAGRKGRSSSVLAAIEAAGRDVPK
jgi:hypothetical protein